MQTAAHRAEERVPIKVVVDMASLDIRLPAQEGVTENVSARGARVVTSKPWHSDDRLNVRSLLGDFRSRARVVYCEPLKNGCYAVGLQLFAAVGSWRSPN